MITPINNVHPTDVARAPPPNFLWLPRAPRCYKRQDENPPSRPGTDCHSRTAIRHRVDGLFHVARIHALVFPGGWSSSYQRTKDNWLSSRQHRQNNSPADKNRRLAARNLPRLSGAHQNNHRLRRMAPAALFAFSRWPCESTLLCVHHRPGEGPRSTNHRNRHNRTELHRVLHHLRQENQGTVVSVGAPSLSRLSRQGGDFDFASLRVRTRVSPTAPRPDTSGPLGSRCGCPHMVHAIVGRPRWAVVVTAPAPVRGCTRRPTRSSRRCAPTCRSRRRSCSWLR